MQLIRNICVYGIGGVGGYFGAKIAHAINQNQQMGSNVYFIARGAHLNAIQRNGITVVSPNQTIVGKPALATDDVNQIPDPDLILLCVKSYDLDGVVKSIRSKVNPNTVIIPLLNGADIYDRIRVNLDTAIVLPACVFVGTHIKEPGVIAQNGGDGRILFGKDPKHNDVYPDAVIATFSKMGITCKWNDDPLPAIWSKYMFIASFGLITVFSGKNLGQIMDDDGDIENVRQIMGEIFDIAEKKGIRLPPDIIEKSIAKAHNFPYDTKTSYQRDVELKGSLNEGDLYGGTIIRAGKALGLATPVTNNIYTAIQNRF